MQSQTLQRAERAAKNKKKLYANIMSKYPPCKGAIHKLCHPIKEVKSKNIKNKIRYIKGTRLGGQKGPGKEDVIYEHHLHHRCIN